MNEFKHTMIDIETLGTKSNSAILSIGAVNFNIETGQTDKEFYRKISLKSCFDIGLNADPDTICWWMSQDSNTKKDLFKDDFLTVSIDIALNQLSAFFGQDCDQLIWANSPRFDLGLLQDAYNKLNLPIPWNFRNERCVRTLVSFNSTIKNKYKLKNQHNALSDCYNQIGYCTQIWKTIKVKNDKTSGI